MKNVWKKLLSVLIVAAIIFPALPARAAEEIQGPEIYGQAYAVMDYDTGDMIIYKNPNERLFPASITKIVTAIVVLEHVKDLSQKTTVKKSAIEHLSPHSSTMNPPAKVGEILTINDLLHGLLLPSGNECANILAEYVAGSQQAFVDMMNREVRDIGAKNTHFTNPHGLHNPNHYTTAADMVKIFRYCLANKRFREIDSCKAYTVPQTNMTPPRHLTMSHRLITGKIACEGVFAGKTGRTHQAGRTLLTAAKRQGRTLIACVLKSSDDKVYQDTNILMEYGFGIATGKMKPVVWQKQEMDLRAKGNVRIREFPSLYADDLGTVKEGGAAHQISYYGDWAKILLSSGKVGYVSRKYLEPASDWKDHIETEPVDLQHTGEKPADVTTTADATTMAEATTAQAATTGTVSESRPAESTTSAEVREQKPSKTDLTIPLLIGGICLLVVVGGGIVLTLRSMGGIGRK